MKKLLFILLLTALFSKPSAAQTADYLADTAHQSPVYIQLADLARTAPPDQVVASIARSLQDGSLDDAGRQATLVFLSENSYGQTAPEKIDIDYFLLYADTQLIIMQPTVDPATRAAQARGALDAFHHFEALATTDGLRCADPTAWPAFKAQLITPRLGGTLRQAYTAVQPKNYKAFIEPQLAYDDTHIGRPVNAEICGAGDKKSPAAVIDPVAWNQKRMAAHDGIRQMWIERYESINKRKL